DPDWQKINDNYSLTYKERPKKGSEGEAFDYKEHPYNGFVNSYATYSIDKDMGQTYAYLMINEKQILLNKWIKSDKVLNEKVSYLKSFLNEVSSSLDENYFKSFSKKSDTENDSYEENNEDKKTYTEYGLASYYGKEYNGKKTANGEIFDDSILTAAHKTLSFGTVVKVTNKKNQKEVIVKINDRGPFVKNRIIDLTTAAAKKIGNISDGVWDVKIEVVDNNEKVSKVDTNEKNQDKKYTPDFDKLFNNLPKNQDVSRLQEFIKDGIQNKIDIKNLTADNLVKTAKKYLGAPYVTGGTSLSGMDCTGLTYRSFVEWGIEMPREGHQQARYGTFITSKDDLKPGDLVFFTRTYNTQKFITHAGIYVGDKKFVNANSYYGRVMEDIIDDNYWKQFYIFGVRYF
ncbi:MAG TPA: septal ring lytic transglycosylase RlpA family protein, partial [Spirochaetota bacterium]|nr:septal ring lytic transglycosylase RlpA family protein [Spirochaetota bacterium]